MIRIAFITLLERKVLAFVQIRLGPNKVSLYGIFQPFADALKLLSKGQLILFTSNKFLYFFTPGFLFLSILLFWLSVESKFNLGFEFNVLFFLFLRRISVYFLIGSGWASNSKYGILGAYRALAQVISYEVSLSFYFLSFFIFSNNFSFLNLSRYQELNYLFTLNIILFILWIVVSLAETNRTPFDFAEGESELVSGFNIEYGSGLFVVIFLAEYGALLFISKLTRIIFFANSNLFLIINLFLVLLIRGVFIRFRYDFLIRLAWKILLPLSILISFFYLNIICIKVRIIKIIDLSLFYIFKI